MKVAASAKYDEVSDEIIDLTNKLLLEEIDMERYYLQYRIYGNAEPKTRRLRYFMFQQAAGCAFLSSNIVNMYETAKHFRTPEEVSSKVFTRSNRTGLTACTLGVGSSSLELCSNGWIAAKNIIKKHDPATARRVVKKKLEEIDALAAKRDSLVENNKDHPAYQAFVTEGKLLKSFRDWCVYEFTDVYADIRSNQPSTNVFYMMDIGAYSMSMASYILALQTTRKPDLVYPSLHTGMVSNGLFTLEAPLTTLANAKLYKYHFNRLSKDLKETPIDTEEDAKKLMLKLESQAAHLDEETLEHLGAIASRLSIYSYWSTRYDKFIDRRLVEIRRQSRIALQGNVSGPLIGATSLAQDTFNAIALYKCKNNPYAANALAFAGAAATTCSSAASVGLSGWWFVDQLRHDKQYEKARLLPEMLLEDRLKTLLVLEEMLDEKAGQK